MSLLCYNDDTIKKQSFLENKFKYFESIKFRNINFKIQFWYNNWLEE